MHSTAKVGELHPLAPFLDPLLGAYVVTGQRLQYVSGIQIPSVLPPSPVLLQVSAIPRPANLSDRQIPS